MIRKNKLLESMAIFFALVVFKPETTLPADTVETWDEGASDLDFYLGMDGIGPSSGDKNVYGEIMLGYGLFERFSGYLGTTLQGNEHFSDGSAGLFFGVFGTPVDTDHFDLDFFLDVSGEGAGFEQFSLSPALELNLDFSPDMDSLGLYLRAPFPIQGRKLSSEEHLEPDGYSTTLKLETTFGVYCTIAKKHQVLIEYDMGFHPWPYEGERKVDVGGFSLGYNVLLVDRLELISQVGFEVPQGNESFSVGFMAGIIATIPSVSSSN